MRSLPSLAVILAGVIAACQAPGPGTPAVAPTASVAPTATETPAPAPTPARGSARDWASVIRLADHAPGPPPKTILDEPGAIDFALALPDVKSKVTPLEAWWGKAAKRDPSHPERWFISFGQGDNACNTEYQCTLQVESDGTVSRPFECTHGWNCK